MHPASRQADVLIVGGGIIGAACAREFAAQGLSVSVIERGALGGGATAASMGHLLVVDGESGSVADRAEHQLSLRSMQLWQQWLQSQPQRAAEVEQQQLGTLWVAADDEEFALAERKAQWLSAQGLAASVIDAARLQQLEPALRPGLRGALHVAGDGRVYPPKLAAQWLAESGATLLRGEVAAIEPGGVRLYDGRRLWAAMVVLAGGLESRRFLPEGWMLAKKGHLAITQRQPQTLVSHQLVELGYIKKAHLVDEDTVSFNVQPRPGGQLLIGSSRQIGKEDPAVELPMLARMLRCASDYLPALREQSILRCWTGLRPASRDGLPLLGAHPSLRQCWIACGHEGLGISTALGSAELLATIALGLEPSIDAAAFVPSRFAAP